jgi:transaldolase
MAQAIACAQAGVYLISPFVGRINDGHSTKYAKTFKPEEEPGVLIVKEMYNYYKKFGYHTIVMVNLSINIKAASLRTPESAFELAGVDRMTIPPGVIEKMDALTVQVNRKLNEEEARNSDIEKIEMNEKVFRWMLNEDEIGNEKLADGIRLFAKGNFTRYLDTLKLEKIIKDRLNK